VAEFAVQIAEALRDRYLFERELGRGGMATVYLARDLKHDRQVALKVLHQQLASVAGVRRFLREIGVAARLHHPHLLPVYDSGEAGGSLYYVVPYIAGGSLRDRLRQEERLPIDLALQLTREVADALDFAHRHDVIHRDIKPENILLEDEHAIVADFGVARALSVAADTDTLTQPGLAIGTPAYMSPEQGRGAPVDGRSDVYSLGCVLYEMLTGTLPCAGQKLREADGSFPAALEDAVDRALAESPKDRFQTAAAFAQALGGRSGHHTAVAGARRLAIAATIAVLPFVNLSPASDDEYFSDGMSEELINALTKVGRLHVASRTSAFAFKGKTTDVREIGQRLGVGAVLEGSVRRSGTRLRITAQLVSTEDGYHLWSETYDREVGDVFAVQDELSRAIVDALQLQLTKSEDRLLVQPATQNLAAYTDYLRGRYYSSKRSPEGLRRAVECFTSAVAADPSYALAHAGLAESYHLLAIYGVLPPREVYPKARSAATRAIELNELLPEAHVPAGCVALCFDWKWAAAERELRRAIELNGSHAQAHHWLAWCLLITGRAADAAAAARRAMELEPLSPIIQARAGHILAYAGQSAESEAAILRALELNPQFLPAIETLSTLYTRRRVGRYKEAAEALSRVADVPGSNARYFLPWVCVLMGHVEEARQRLKALDFDPAEGRGPPTYTVVWLVAAHASLGDTDEAFRWLERAVADRVFTAPLIGVEEECDPLRGDPRFAALEAAVGLRK
jgi:TolB-like protein/Tfp pilus assembly protein PilF